MRCCIPSDQCEFSLAQTFCRFILLFSGNIAQNSYTKRDMLSHRVGAVVFYLNFLGKLSEKMKTFATTR